MNMRSKEALENARSKLCEAKGFLDKGEGTNCVADYITDAMNYAFREEAAFDGRDTIGNIQLKAKKLNFWLLGDPDIPQDRPFSMKEWKSAAYALIEEARVVISLTERDCP